FDSDSDLSIIQMQAHAPAPDICQRAAWISRPVGDLVMRALAKRAQDRYQSAGELASAFEAAVALQDMFQESSAASINLPATLEPLPAAALGQAFKPDGSPRTTPSARMSGPKMAPTATVPLRLTPVSAPGGNVVVASDANLLAQISSAPAAVPPPQASPAQDAPGLKLYPPSPSTNEFALAVRGRQRAAAVDGDARGLGPVAAAARHHAGDGDAGRHADPDGGLRPHRLQRPGRAGFDGSQPRRGDRGAGGDDGQSAHHGDHRDRDGDRPEDHSPPGVDGAARHGRLREGERGHHVQGWTLLGQHPGERREQGDHPGAARAPRREAPDQGPASRFQDDRKADKGCVGPVGCGANRTDSMTQALLLSALLAFSATPRKPSGRLTAAQAEFSRGDFAAALRDLDAAVSETGDDPTLSKIHLLRGQCYGAQRDLVKAEEAFEKALESDPEAKLDPQRVDPSLVSLLEGLRDRMQGELEVRTDRPAKVHLDGKPIGLSPVKASVAIGRHKLEAHTGDGKYSASSSVVIAAHKT